MHQYFCVENWTHNPLLTLVSISISKFQNKPSLDGPQPPAHPWQLESSLIKLWQFQSVSISCPDNTPPSTSLGGMTTHNSLIILPLLCVSSCVLSYSGSDLYCLMFSWICTKVSRCWLFKFRFISQPRDCQCNGVWIGYRVSDNVQILVYLDNSISTPYTAGNWAVPVYWIYF